jgi:hypothetical protein
MDKEADRERELACQGGAVVSEYLTIGMVVLLAALIFNSIMTRPRRPKP